MSKFSVDSAINILSEFISEHNIPHFTSKYNIIINEDGSVYDKDLKSTYNSLYNWAYDLKEKSKNVRREGWVRAG